VKKIHVQRRNLTWWSAGPIGVIVVVLALGLWTHFEQPDLVCGTLWGMSVGIWFSLTLTTWGEEE
jgi:heme A synthase